jgi:putative acetyltransferase
MHAIDIRQSRSDDMASIEKLYPAAFPEEDLLPLVQQLLTEDAGILSLVAEAGGLTVGHILFTLCGISGSEARAALLAPLCVAPPWQRKGIGSALIRDGLSRLEQGRRGPCLCTRRSRLLRGAADSNRKPASPRPYPLPEEYREAWQSLSLGSAQPPADGKLKLPDVWMKPELWGP